MSEGDKILHYGALEKIRSGTEETMDTRFSATRSGAFFAAKIRGIQNMAILRDQEFRADVEAALAELSKINLANSDIAFASAKLQLDYLLKIAKDELVDDSRLEEITLGYIAAYQLAGVIPDSLWKRLSGINEKVRRALRMNGRTLLIDKR